MVGVVNFQVYFGTVQARIYLVADFLRVNCHTGMSALMRKALIDEVGGIEAFSCYLAEDFFFAKSLKERGWRMCISSQPAWQNSGVCEINSFQARLTRSVLRIMVRWCYSLQHF
jgi:ceramide glucosyltransferase